MPDPVEYAQAYGTQSDSGGRKAAPWIIGGIVALVVIALVVVFAVRQLSGGTTGPNGGRPTATNTAPICPPGDQDPSAAPEQLGDGYIRAGHLAYRDPGAPWSPPVPETRVPFSRAALTQQVMVEEAYEPGSSWVASLTIGELLAGDGFFSPEDGAEVVVRCVVGSFYGQGTEVHREDLRNEAITVDGRDAWVIESNLSFDIPNLQTTEELLIVIIVDTGEASSGLFYVSIPNTVPELEAPAREAIASLIVE